MALWHSVWPSQPLQPLICVSKLPWYSSDFKQSHVMHFQSLTQWQLMEFSSGGGRQTTSTTPSPSGRRGTDATPPFTRGGLGFIKPYHLSPSRLATPTIHHSLLVVPMVLCFYSLNICLLFHKSVTSCFKEYPK